jgi:hypothetical protein
LAQGTLLPNLVFVALDVFEKIGTQKRENNKNKERKKKNKEKERHVKQKSAAKLRLRAD